MQKKFIRILGIALLVVLILTLFLVATPASAAMSGSETSTGLPSPGWLAIGLIGLAIVATPVVYMRHHLARMWSRVTGINHQRRTVELCGVGQNSSGTDEVKVAQQTIQQTIATRQQSTVTAI